MSHRIPLRVLATFALLGGISTNSQGATSLDTPASSTVAAVPAAAAVITPVIAPAITPVIAPAITPVIAPVITPAASAVIATPPAAPIATLPAATKSPTPPKVAKKVHKRVVAHHAKPAVAAAFNQPYTELGVKYTPLQNAVNYLQRGEATWYSKSHQGIATVNGEIYDIYGMTAAHPTLPIPSYARVTNLSNGKSVVVRINDRGPFGYNQKIIDLSYSAANKIGLVNSSNRLVEIASLAQEPPITHQPKTNIIFKSLVQPRPDLKPRPDPKPHLKPRSAPKPAVTGAVYLQLGAFKTAAAAQTFMQKAQQQLGDKPLTILVQAKLHRVRTDSYPNAAEALTVAAEINKKLGFQPLLKPAN